MATKRIPFANSTAIQQITDTGVAFDGQFPENGLGVLDAPLVNNSVYKFPVATVHAGLFFWDANEPIICGQFHIDLRGSGNISLYVVNLDVNNVPIVGEEILIEQQTGVQFVALDEARFKAVLLPKQGLKLVTTVVVAQKQIAQAVASIERTYVR